MPQNPYNFESDFQPYQSYDFDSDFQPFKPEPAKSFPWFDFLGSSIDSNSTTRPTEGTYSPGTYAPGEAHAPSDYMDYSKDSFSQGFFDIPREMYNYVDELGRRGAAQIREGNLTGAANTIYDPLISPIAQPAKIAHGLYTGEVKPEQGKQYGFEQLAGLSGLPMGSVKEAWAQQDVPRLIGQSAGTLTMLHGAHAVGEAFKPNAPVEANPPAGPSKREWIESLKETPPEVHGPEIGPYGTGDPRFGQQAFDFEVQPDLLAGGVYRGPSGRMTKSGPALPPKMGPEVGELPPQSPSFENPWLEPNVDQGNLFGKPAAPSAPLSNESLMGQGWRKSPSGGLVFPESRPPVATEPVSTTPPAASPVTTTPPTVTRGQVLSSVAPKGPRQGIRVNRDGSLTIPNELATEQFLKGRAEAGYTESVQNPDGTITLRKPGGTSAGMFFDPRALELIKEKLRTMFGREPTDIEVQATAERESSSPLGERGLVAPFNRPIREDPSAQFYDDQITTRGGQESQRMMPGIEAEIRAEREMAAREGSATISSQGPFAAQPVQQPPSVTNEPRFPEMGPVGEGVPPNRPVVPGIQIPAEAQGLDVAPLRQTSLFGPTSAELNTSTTTPDMVSRLMGEVGAETDPTAARAATDYWGRKFMATTEGRPDPGTTSLADASLNREQAIRRAELRNFEGPYKVIQMGNEFAVVDTPPSGENAMSVQARVADRATAESIAREMNMTEAVLGMDMPRDVKGQQELPWSRGEAPPVNRLQERAYELEPANVDQMFRGVEEPREQQLSMMADFIDNEIDQHFQEQGIESRPSSAATNGILDIADRIINQREEGDRYSGGPENATETSIMDMVHDARDKWHENERGEGQERTASSRVQQHQNDRAEIDSTTDISRARAIRDYWSEAAQTSHSIRTRTGGAERSHASDMAVHSAQRVVDLNRLESERRNPPLTQEQIQQRTRDLDEINSAQTTTEASQIRDQWQQNVEDAVDVNDYSTERHAREMRRRASDRITELLDANRERILREREQRLQAVQGSRPSTPPPPTPSRALIEVYDQISGRTVETFHTELEARNWIEAQPNPRDFDFSGPASPAIRNLERARAATGVLNPPIQFGVQPKQPRGLRYTPEQIERLKESTNEVQVNRELELLRERAANRAAGIKGQKKEPTAAEKWWRDVWAPARLREIPQTGDPGLSIIDTNPNTPAGYNKYYRVEYRDAQGKPVAMAKVTEEANGARRVPTMAADSDHGAYGVAAESVFKALLNMNAADAGHGTISNWTAKLVARILYKMEGTNAGMFDLSQGIKPVLKMVQNLLENKDAYNTKTRDGFAKLMDTLNGVTNTKFWMDKAAEAGWNKGSAASSEGMMAKGIRNETGALNAGAGVNKIVSKVGQGVQAVKQNFGWGQGEMGKKGPDEVSQIKEALRLPGGTTTTLDMSAPGRQGLAMIATPEFWGAAARMFGGLHYDTFKKLDAALRETDLMRVDIDPVTGKDMPSFGSQIGTKIFSPASEPGPRAENTASRWLEMGIGKVVDGKWQPTVGSKLWQHTAGYPIRAANRTHLTFLNYLNVHRTQKLLDLARDMSIKGQETGRMPREGLAGGFQLPTDIKVPFSDRRVQTGFAPGSNIGFTKRVTPEQALDVNPYHNIPRAKEIADFVNTATGHGPLKTHIIPHRGAEVSLESAADKLGHAFFSPGLIASRIRMMNPSTYIMATPFARKQYLKAALSTTAAWFITAQLIKKAAGDEAEVNYDPLSADFGKVRIGNARLDISGGFGQFAVAAARAWVGGATSSATGQYHRFGSGYQAQTQEDSLQNFFTNKLNPSAKFAYDVMSASEYKPFHVGDRTAQLFVPLVMQDFYEIAKEDPGLFPMFGPASFFGAGSQIYSKGESVGKFIDPESDWNVTGGGIRDLMPWNLGVQPGEESNLPRIFPWSDTIP